MAVTTKGAAGGAVRPFTFEASDADLEDLRARIVATRWPERETVTDSPQGVQLETLQKRVCTGFRPLRK